MAKRGRPYMVKVPFSSLRLHQALDHAHISLRELNNDPTLAASEKTIRRAEKNKLINPKILDRLGKRLDVNPDFLSGIYDKRAEIMANGDKEKEAEFKSYIKIEEHPYLEKEKKNVDRWEIMKELLISRDVPLTQFSSLSSDDQIKVYVELEVAINRVIYKFFQPQSYSYIESEIPMPPEDEIVTASW